MRAIETIVPYIRNLFGLSQLEIVVSTDWSSRNPSNRLMLREEVSVRTQCNLKDLRQKPIATGFAVSISHCPLMGGFAYSPDLGGESRVLLGFDLEETKRVTPKIATRISSFCEVAEAPSPAQLWCAKESAFKALTLTPTSPKHKAANETANETTFATATPAERSSLPPRPLVLSHLRTKNWRRPSADDSLNLSPWICDISLANGPIVGRAVTFTTENVTGAVFSR